MNSLKTKRGFFSFVLFGILLFGLLLRLIAANPGYPPNHPDEPVIYSTAVNMVLNNEPNPFKFGTYRFQYPGFIIYLHAFMYSLIFIPLTFFISIIQHPHEFLESLNYLDKFMANYVVGLREINVIFWGRYVNALFSFLSLPLIYLIGKKMFNKYVGLFAVLFLAFNFRHFLSSILSLIDGPNSSFALLALYFTLCLMEKPNRKNYILAGIAVGLSFSTKLYFFSLFPFLFVHLILVLRKRNGREIIKNLINPNVVLSLIIIALIFVATNPFLFLYLQNAIKQQTLNNIRYGFGIIGFYSQPVWFLYKIGLGQALSIFAFVGFISILLRREYWLKGTLLLLLIIPPSFVLLIYSHGGVYTRNLTNVVPFVIIFSALGLFEIVRLVSQKIVNSKSKAFLPLFLTAGILVGFFQIKLVTSVAYSQSHPWNLNCITDWMERNIREKQKIARTAKVSQIKPEENTYLSYSNISYAFTGDRQVYIKTVFSLKELQEDNYDYAIIDYDSVSTSFLFWISRYWNLPVDVLDNTFDSIAIQELNRYKVKDCIKPWPSIDDNYSVFKIPKKQNSSMLDLVEEENKTFTIKSQKTKYKNQEQLMLIKGVPIKEGGKYLIQAMIKTNARIPSEARDGFIRVDFYGSPEKTWVKNTAISARIWGDSKWQKKEVSQVSPRGVKYLSVGFQAENYETDFYIKDIKIYLLKDKVSKEEINSANAERIDYSILYPVAVW